MQNSLGKKRLVFNLRHLNQFVCKQNFGYDDLSRGLRISNDGLCAASGQQTALEATWLEDTLDRAVFVTHPTNSVWLPTRRLGFVVDATLGQIEVPKRESSGSVQHPQLS